MFRYEFENEIMDKSKKQRLQSQGWKVGTVEYFLELTPQEATLIEIRRSSLGKDKGKFVSKSAQIKYRYLTCR